MPEESFELYPTGTRRRICRHCHYVLHMRKGRLKWVMRQRAKALISLTGGQARCEVEPHSVPMANFSHQLLCHFSSFGKAENEARTFVILSVEPNLAAKELDDGLADGKSQTSEFDVVA